MVFTSRTLLSDPGWNFEMGEKSCDLPRGEGWPGEGWGGEVGEEGFWKVEDGIDGEEGEEKDVNGGEVELEESDGKGTVVKEEKEVKSGRVEDEEGEEGDEEAEEKDCVEGADAKEEENRAEGSEVRDEIGEDGVGMEEEEEERGIDEDWDKGLGCLTVNVESVERIGDCGWSFENVE